MSTKLKSPNPITEPKMKKVLLTLITFYFLGLTINAEETMYKNPGCMCCDRWVEHMNENGFDLGITPSEKMNELKIALGIPEQVRGCHTTVIDGIIVEGHVPADLVQRILRERPEGIIGISVPNMPMGSPGMEGAYKEDYPVVVFDAKGKIFLYEMR